MMEKVTLYIHFPLPLSTFAAMAHSSAEARFQGDLGIPQSLEGPARRAVL